MEGGREGCGTGSDDLHLAPALSVCHEDYTSMMIARSPNWHSLLLAALDINADPAESVELHRNSLAVCSRVFTVSVSRKAKGHG